MRYIELFSPVGGTKKPTQVLSVYDFFYALARLGGHQNRKGDHQPGWLILWPGWDGPTTHGRRCRRYRFQKLWVNLRLQPTFYVHNLSPISAWAKSPRYRASQFDILA